MATHADLETGIPTDTPTPPGDAGSDADGPSTTGDSAADAPPPDPSTVDAAATDSSAMDPSTVDSPAEPRTMRRGRLTGRERRIVAAWALAPIALAALALSPFVIWGGASLGQLLAAALVYGGLVALATGFVAQDRMQSRQCPRCTSRLRTGDPGCCVACGYDLAERPRWRCDEGHEVVLDPGMCSCGRRLVRRDPPRGIRREVVAVLKAGGWILLFLMVLGFLLQRLGG